MANSLACNIVLLPDSRITEMAIKASQDLEKFGTLFTLKIGSFYPHISIYRLQLPETDFEKARSLLESIAKSRQVFNLRAENYNQGERYWDVEYQKPDTLAQLQIKAVSIFEALREGLRENDRIRLATATGLVKENLEKYGDRAIGQLYRPHLTLTRFVDKPPLSLDEASPAVSEFSGEFPELGLFEMGENGTCRQRITSFKLSASIS